MGARILLRKNSWSSWKKEQIQVSNEQIYNMETCAIASK